jgi:hypothetical protein
VADTAPTIPQSTAGQSEKHGLLGTLSSLGHAAKTAAVVAAKEAERAKINNVDLPKAYAALGRDVHGRGAYQEEFSDLYGKIDDLLARLRNLEGDSSKQPNPPTTFADKAKAAAVATKQKAEVQAMRLQLSRLMSKLGEAVYQRHGNAAGSSETTGPIASLLSRASTLGGEVEQQRRASGGRFLTRRRVAVAAATFCACVILIGLVCSMVLQESSKRKIAQANALWENGQQAEAVALYKDARNFAPSADKSGVYGRILDFEASQGNDTVVQKFAKEAADRRVAPDCFSEAAKTLMATAATTPAKSSGATGPGSKATRTVIGDPSVDFDGLDFDTVDLSRGPQGQPVQVKHELDGQVTSRGYIGTDGKWYEHGRQVMCDPAGRPGTESSFVYGRQHGTSLCYDDSKTTEAVFFNGKLVKQIVWRDRERTSKMEEETFSKDGKQLSHYIWERDGTLLMRSEDGKIIE